jgi:hypothetical protein
MSMEASDKEAAAGAKAPRVALSDIEGAVLHRFDTTGDKIAQEAPVGAESLGVLSICLLVMRNGFTVIGKSAPASLENFNPELGKKLAYEDAIRQLWPLMGYALREKLSSKGEMK